MTILESYETLSKVSSDVSQIKASNIPMYLAVYIEATQLHKNNLKDYLYVNSPTDFFKNTGINIDYQFIKSNEDFMITTTFEILSKEEPLSNLKEEVYYALRLIYDDYNAFIIKDKKITHKALWEISHLYKELNNPFAILPNVSKSTLNELSYLNQQGEDLEELLSQYLSKPVTFIKKEDEIYKIENYIGFYVKDLDDVAILPLESYGELAKLLKREVSFVKQNSTLYINDTPIEVFLPKGHMRSSLKALDYR